MSTFKLTTPLPRTEFESKELQEAFRKTQKQLVAIWRGSQAIAYKNGGTVELGDLIIRMTVPVANSETARQEFRKLVAGVTGRQETPDPVK